MTMAANRQTFPAAAMVGFIICVSSSHAQAPASLGADRPRIGGPLGLKQAVQTALRSNLGVQGMLAEARAAHAETRATQAMTKPQVSANSFATAGDMESMLGSSPDVSPAFSRDVPAKGFAMQNLNLMVPIYTGGRLGNLVRAASQRARAADANVGGSQADTALNVRIAYYRALLGSDFMDVANARLTAATELVRTTEVQFEAGKSIQASVSRAQAEEADAQRMVTSATNEQAKAMLDLKAAMGVSLESDISLSDALAVVSPTGDLSSDLVDAARIRPELQAARARLEAARAQTGAARGSSAPQVYAAAMADAWSSRAMGDTAGYTVGLTMSLPLFDAGQRRAEVAQARAMQDRAQADLSAAELMVANEVRQARLDVQTAEQNFRTAQSSVTAARQAYGTTLLRVQSGKGILVEQLDSLAALTQARANLAQALYDHSTAVAKLHRAIGRN